MAGGNSYKLLLQAEVDAKSLQAQIDAASKKSVLIMKMQLDPTSQSKFDAEMKKITDKAKSIGKISFSADGSKAVVDYTDKLNQSVKATISLKDKLETAEAVTKNLAKDARELAKAYQDAEKFLSRSQKMNVNDPKVSAGIGIAQQLKVAASQGDIDSVRKLSGELNIAKSALSGVNQGVKSWTAGMAQSIKTTVQYAASVGMLYAALGQIKDGVQYIKDLNKELTNIQLVTGDTDAQTAQLAVGYNNLAKEMGTTTIEIAKGSLEFIRQGKTAEDTATLIKNSTMMAKLGNMEAAESSEALTSIMNGFKLSAEETGTVVDKLVAIDNSAATSVQELSRAMQYSSATAQQVGIDFDHLAAYIGTISSVTRRSSEEIGQSMKTVALRMTAIKNMDAFDSEGEAVNKVEAALKGVNVNLRDGEGHFRDLQDVLDELAKKWNTLSREEQIFIAQQIGGVRQADKLLALLSNEAEIQKQLNAERDSTNLRLERYDIYLKSIEASQNKMTASWEEMVSSGATKDMIVSWYEGGTAVLEFINSIGGIPTVLKIVIPLLVLFNLELIRTTTIAKANAIWGLGASLVTFGKDLGAAISLMKAGTSATTALNLAFGTTAVTVGAVALALASVIAVIYTYNEQVAKTQEAGLEETASHWATIFDEVKTNGGEAVDILEKYKAGVDAINKSHEEGGIIADLFVDKQAMIDSGLKETIDALAETSTSYDDYIKKVKEAAEVAGYKVGEKGLYTGEGRGRQYSEDIAIATAQEFNDAVNRELAEQEVLLFGDPESLISKANETGVDAATSLYEGFSETLKALADTSSVIDDLVQKSNEGTLTIEDAAKVPTEYLSALTVVGDKLQFNIDKLKETQLEEARLAVERARASGAAVQEISVLQFAYDQLLAQSQNTFGQFNQTAWQYDALLWQIANDAEAAGYQFVDMEGKALTSAQNIHEYLASSPQAFSNFVEQVANATGRTVAEVTNIINQMINNTIARLNSLGGMSGGLSPDERDEGGGGSSAPPPLFPNPPPSYGGGSGGGGSGGNEESEELKRQREELERIRELERQIAEARNKAIDGLKSQLSAYKKIIDARKDLLDTLEDERQYQKAVEEKNRDILSVQNELSALQFDDSEEAQARRRQLEEQLSQLQSELEDIQTEESIEDQKDALDKEYDRMERRINKAIKAIEAINADSIEGFAAALARILKKFKLPEMHTGGIVGKGASQSGIVGGTSVKSNEILVKMLKGEVVATEAQADNFVKNTLPQIAQSSSIMNGGDMSVSIPIQVMGNLDKDALPGLEKMVKAAVEQLNKNMLSRGYSRRAESFGN